VGAHALLNNTTGDRNTATGHEALLNNTEGGSNVANGTNALSSNTTGDDNVAVGTGALSSNTTGRDNTAVGDGAMPNNTTASNNTGLGSGALFDISSGSSNTAVGYLALSQNTTGIGNIALGADAGSGVTTADAVICIGTEGLNISQSCFIGNIFGATSPSGIQVLVNSDGKLGTVVSSRRFKEEIKPMSESSELLFSLQPVTFRYKKQLDASGASQFGLVAEEVEKVSPDLIVRDKEGKPYSVRYDQVNAMLLNEFLKEHRKVRELESRLTRQEKQMETMAASLQRVSAVLQMDRPTTQMAANDGLQ
jgi:endosialidase-like protein